MNPPENHFLCPHCHLKLACEDGYTGSQIQCPDCGGDLVVPLTAPTGPAFPLHGSSTRPAVAPMRKGQQGGIYAVATTLVGLVTAIIAFRTFLKSWPWTPGAFSIDAQGCLSLGLVAFCIGAAAFAAGVRHAAAFTDTMPVRLLCGFLVPFVATGVGASALALFVGGCTVVACGSKSESAEVARLIPFVFSLVVFGLLWWGLERWLASLRGR